MAVLSSELFGGYFATQQLITETSVAYGSSLGASASSESRLPGFESSLDDLEAT